MFKWAPALQWLHNEHNGVSNHQPHDCLLNCLFRHISKKTSKLRDTGLCAGNSPVTGEFLYKWPVMEKIFPFDDIIMCLSHNHFIVWESVAPGGGGGGGGVSPLGDEKCSSPLAIYSGGLAKDWRWLWLRCVAKVIGNVRHFRWLGPNVWWEISQIWTELRKDHLKNVWWTIKFFWLHYWVNSLKPYSMMHNMHQQINQHWFRHWFRQCLVAWPVLSHYLLGYC